MTDDEVVRTLHADGIQPDAYDLDGSGERNECYVVTKVDDTWAVFYAERGLDTGLRRFLTRGEALEHLLATLRADPTTRR